MKFFEDNDHFVLTIIILFVVRIHVCCVNSQSTDLQKHDTLIEPAESVIAPSVAGGAGGAVGAQQVAQKSTIDNGYKSNATNRSGLKALVGSISAHANSRSAAMKTYKKGGKKRGYASMHGHASRFGKKGRKYVVYASGHKKAYGTVKTYRHSKGFKYGHAGTYGAMSGQKKGFKVEKAHLKVSSTSGADKHASDRSKSFASGDSSNEAFKQAARGSSNQKSSAGGQMTLLAAGKQAGTAGIAAS